MQAMAGILLSAAVACILLAGVVSAAPPFRVMVVGDEARGWRQPAGNEETYNHWASRNRFHVGDFLDFKYAKNDSVLLVSQEDYKFCKADKPTLQFDGGETRFRLDRNGFFFFISGAPGHCNAGQRMTVKVMAHHPGESDAEAPAVPPTAGETPGARSVPAPPQGKGGHGSASGSASVRADFAAVGVVLGAAMLVVLA